MTFEHLKSDLDDLKWVVSTEYISDFEDLVAKKKSKNPIHNFYIDYIFKMVILVYAELNKIYHQNSLVLFFFPF